MEEQENKEIEKTEDKKGDYFLPLSIVIAALLISGAWVYTAGFKSNNSANQAAQVGQVANQPDSTQGVISVKPVSAKDHILGNPEAPVKIIEFSDLECPFCKMFQQTMTQVMAEYGQSGKVAWIFRNFPLDQLHPKARTSAQGAECANELGGNDKFWAYVNEYYKITPSNNQIDLSALPKIATDIGLDKDKFESCLNSGKYNSQIDASIQDAENAGGQGTPYSVVVAQDGRKFAIGGAQPYAQVKAVIDEALR